MSNHEQRPDQQPDTSNFAEILKRLQDGSLFDGEGTHIHNINVTPEIDEKMFLDREGNLVYNFAYKFTKDFNGWEPGSKVRSKFLVRPIMTETGEKIELYVSESVVGDIRRSDSFTLENVSENHITALKKLGLAEIEADVEVVAPGENTISNMYSYQARLDKIHSVQPFFDGDFSKLEKGSVLVQGEVISYESNTNHHPGKLSIRLTSGQVIKIELWNGYVSFEGGTLEILSPDYPLRGEKIQVSTQYGNPNARYGKQEDDRLYAFWCRSTFLVGPGQERQEAYTSQRRQVAEYLQAIEQATSSEVIRANVSSLINRFHAKKGSFSRPTLTKRELHSIRQLVTNKIEKEQERPLDVYEDLYVVEDIIKVYGVDVTSMSKVQFRDFCMDIAKGEMLPQGEGSSDYPWRLLDQLEPEVSEEILQTAVRSLAAKVIGKDVLLKSNQSKKGINTVSWEVKYLFDQSLSYLSSYASSSTARIYLDLVQMMTARDLFRKEDSDRKEYAEYEIFAAIERNILENTQWDWKQKNVVSIVNETVAAEYTSCLPMFRRLNKKMKAEAWTNQGRLDQSEYVEKVIRILEQVDSLMKPRPTILN